MKTPQYTWICSRCKGTNIVRSAWQYYDKSNDVWEDTGEDGPADDYCNDCEQPSEFHWVDEK